VRSDAGILEGTGMPPLAAGANRRRLGLDSKQESASPSRYPATLGLRPLPFTVPLPVFGPREGDINIAPPPSIVDPAATVRSRLISLAAIAAVRAATGV